LKGGKNINEIMEDVIASMKNCWHGRNSPKALTSAINEVKKLANLDKQTTMLFLSRKPLDDIDEWNCYAAAWRTIERSMEYQFKNGDQIEFCGKVHTIIQIDLDGRTAKLDDKSIVPLAALKTHEIYEQLSFF